MVSTVARADSWVQDGRSGGGGPASLVATSHAPNRGATATRIPVKVIIDKAAAYPHVLAELAPSVGHWTEAYTNNRIKADHGQLSGAYDRCVA